MLLNVAKDHTFFEEVADSALSNLMKLMWNQNPDLRPDTAYIIAKVEQSMVMLHWIS